VDGKIAPVDDRVEVAPGLRLRVLRWLPADGDGIGGGRGSPFLLVHGLASNARLWDGIAGRLARSGRTAVAVDLRGHGRSDKPDTGYDFATCSGDLKGLLEALGSSFARPIMAGQSWGASVVLDFAVRYPEMTSGIVLVDGGLTDLRDGFPTWEDCWERLAPPRLVGLPLSAIQGYFRDNHGDWPKEGIEGSLANFEIRPDGTIAPWLSEERHRAILRAMWEQRTADLWRSLRVPALIVPVDGGQVEWTAGKRAGVEAAVAAAGSLGTLVRVRWLEGDHDIHAQRPDELVDLMLGAEREGLFSRLPAVDHGSRTESPA
jgi:pimeloyl-ACP methyl ester carboxylesterase